MTLIARMVVLCLVLLATPAAAAANGMSIDCATSKEPFAPAVCGSRYLRSLDAHMTGLYRDLAARLTGPPLNELKTAQANWWKGRAACASATDAEACTENSLVGQIALLRAYRDSAGKAASSAISRTIYDAKFGAVDALLEESIPTGRRNDERDARIEAMVYALGNNQSDFFIAVEAYLRAIMLLIINSNYDLAIQFVTFPHFQNYDRLTQSQKLRHALLKIRAETRGRTARATMLQSLHYCTLLDGCDAESGHENDDAALLRALWLGYPADKQRKLEAARLEPEVWQDAAALKIRILQEDAALRAAEEQERQKLAAAEAAARQAAELEEQRRINAKNAAREAAEAAERAADEEKAHQLHRTFRYQAGLLGGAFMASLRFIWAFVPFWVYGVAAALALFVHRHLALRITFGIAAFAVIAYGALYAGPIGALLPGGPAPLLAAVWQAWTAYNPDIDQIRLTGNIVFTYVPVAVIAYCLTLALVGRDVRAAEAYRLRGFLPGWLRSWRYGFTQWRAERAERRRLLRDAKFQARLAAIQAAGGAGNYAMAGPGGVPVVRLQRTLGDHIRVFGSVMGVLFGAGTLLFSWYVWYTDSASSWLAWIGQALWKSMKQEAGW